MNSHIRRWVTSDFQPVLKPWLKICFLVWSKAFLPTRPGRSSSPYALKHFRILLRLWQGNPGYQKSRMGKENSLKRKLGVAEVNFLLDKKLYMYTISLKVRHWTALNGSRGQERVNRAE